MTALLDLPTPCEADVKERLQEVFGSGGNAPIPSVGRRSLRAYYQYLATHLSFPFQADYYSETEPLGFGRAFAVTCLLDPEKHPVDSSGSLLCTVLVSGHKAKVPLAELKTDDDTVNRRLIDDYWHWFWNCQ